jgi:predicted transcriptional regulator
MNSDLDELLRNGESLTLEFLKAIEKIAGKMAPGRAPSFSEAQVVKALEIIDTCGTVGRVRLSNELELGEGATRTFLRHAKNEGIIDSSRQGIRLSEYGTRLVSDLRSKISGGVEVPSSPLTVGRFNVAVLVRDAARKVRRGVEQRDAAVRMGALGATTLVLCGNKLTMPSSERDVFKGISSVHDMLVSKLNPNENDAIIVGSGESRKLAELGAKMGALELLRTED